jgi:hypothetical protein
VKIPGHPQPWTNGAVVAELQQRIEELLPAV